MLLGRGRDSFAAALGVWMCLPINSAPLGAIPCEQPLLGPEQFMQAQVTLCPGQSCSDHCGSGLVQG